jgi:hypothetical protein
LRITSFFRSAYDDQSRRLGGEKRRRLGDVVLYARNTLLRPRERLLVRRHHRPGAPVCFIVGVPRSGTTLLHQLLARHLEVGYVSNFVARYWMAPLHGTSAWRRAYPGATPDGELRSHLGRADGPHEPHEFSWFWRYWAPFPESDELRPEELAVFDWTMPKLELEALAGWWGRPLVLKNLNHVDLNVPWFAQLLPGSRFVWIERDAAYCVQSVLRSREERYGDQREWWSVRPRGYTEWADLPPEEQVVRQLRAITANLEQSNSALPGRVLRLRYEELTSDPHGALERIARFLDTSVRAGGSAGSLALQGRNAVDVPAAQWARIRALLAATPPRAGREH